MMNILPGTIGPAISDVHYFGATPGVVTSEVGAAHDK